MLAPYYADESVTLYHGDCREVMPSLDAKSVDLVMTDPPFSVPIKYHDAEALYPRSWGDLLVMEPFFADVFKHIRRVVKDDNQTYICCDGDTYPIFFKCAYSLWPQSQLVVWYKPTGRRGRGWLHSHELVLHLRTPQTQYVDGGFRQDVVGIMPVRTLNRQHPAEKPGDLWTFLSEGMARSSYRVLDPFAGGGSVLDWSKARGHQAIGVEIEEQYCEVIARRLSQGALMFDEESA